MCTVYEDVLYTEPFHSLFNKIKHTLDSSLAVLALHVHTCSTFSPRQQRACLDVLLVLHAAVLSLCLRRLCRLSLFTHPGDTE